MPSSGRWREKNPERPSFNKKNKGMISVVDILQIGGDEEDSTASWLYHADCAFDALSEIQAFASEDNLDDNLHGKNNFMHLTGALLRQRK